MVIHQYFLIWKWGIEGPPYGVLNEHSGLLTGMSTFLSKRKYGFTFRILIPNRTSCSGIKRNPQHHAHAMSTNLLLRL